MAVRLVYVHALSSLHAGTGQGVGVIDLPIARERATDLPLIPGSSIKGCLREAHRDLSELFGEQDVAGMLQISDARLLLLPVRCLGATFVWTTCPYVLRRLARDAAAAGLEVTTPVPDLSEGSAHLASEDALIEIGGKKRLVLEEFDFAPSLDGKDWAGVIGRGLFGSSRDWQAEFSKRFAIVDDKSFHHLTQFGTEVTAHVRIDQEKGAVENGALWYQESLPAETVLVSLWRTEARAGNADPDTDLRNLAKERHLQLGGKATTGQGLVRLMPVESLL